MGWYRARRKARAAAKAERALDRLHGRTVPVRHRRGRSGGAGLSDDDWGDILGDVFVGLIEALFKIFD
jgi:hypothetical protein